MTSLMQHVAIAVLRLQGRKRRWANGARLVADARKNRRAGDGDPPKQLGAQTDTMLGFAVHALAPPGDGRISKTVVYLHGGGYIHDFDPRHWSYLQKVVERTGATVLAVQYPLAPEHTWRDSYEDVLAVARMADVVMGDSAGGGFALAIAQSLAAEGIARDVVLISPLVDATMSDRRTPKYDRADPWLATDGALHCGRAWAGADDPARQEISPLFGSFEGLGRVLLFTGTRDVLHPQALQLAAKLPDATVVISRGSVHNYPILPIPEAGEALDALAEFLIPQRDVG